MDASNQTRFLYLEISFWLLFSIKSICENEKKEKDNKVTEFDFYY